MGNSVSKSGLNVNSDYIYNTRKRVFDDYIGELNTVLPSDIIGLCFNYYFQLCKDLRFNDKWRSKPTKEYMIRLFHDDYMLSCKIYDDNVAMKYIALHTEPVSNGVHCWRFKVNNNYIKYIHYSVCLQQMITFFTDYQPRKTGFLLHCCLCRM